MGYRIRVVPEVEVWLEQLRDIDPGAADHADTADHVHTALLLAAGTERDWLQAWYAEMLQRCRIRYERDRGSTG